MAGFAVQPPARFTTAGEPPAGGLASSPVHAGLVALAARHRKSSCAVSLERGWNCRFASPQDAGIYPSPRSSAQHRELRLAQLGAESLLQVCQRALQSRRNSQRVAFTLGFRCEFHSNREPCRRLQRSEPAKMPQLISLVHFSPLTLQGTGEKDFKEVAVVPVPTI